MTVITVQEAGIDWITCTAAEGSDSVALSCALEIIADLLVAEGYKRRPWAQWGFTGESVRHCSFGHRSEATVGVLSGNVANSFFDDVCRRATKVSRVDIAVTVKTEPPLEGVARRAYEQLIAAGPGKRNGATASVIESSDGSSTSYLGRRISDKWLRVYDKWRESGDDEYRGCWRYELEVKNAPAMDLCRYLLASTDRASDVAATVYRHCTARGLKPIYTPDAEGLLLLAPRAPTELEQRVNWLAKSVSKAAQEVSSALGPTALLRILGVDVDGESPLVDHSAAPHGHHAYESYDRIPPE